MAKAKRTEEEILKSARKKKASERDDEEKAAIKKAKEKKAGKRQDEVTSAITKAVQLNTEILEASVGESIADRIESLRDALVKVEIVRSEVRGAIKQKSLLPSIEVIINQARDNAEKAWAKALDEIRAIEVDSNKEKTEEE